MDEVKLPLDYQNGQKNFFYESNDTKERREVEPLKSRSPWFARQQILTARSCWRGSTGVYDVPVKATLNSAHFIKDILAPVILVDVPNLYASEKTRLFSILIPPELTPQRTPTNGLMITESIILRKMNGWPICREYLQWILLPMDF
jgi:hypothetical protein